MSLPSLPPDLRRRRGWLPRALSFVAVVALLLCGCAPRDDGGPATESRRAAREAARSATRARVPEKAIVVYQHVLRTGRAPSGYVGGRVFENRERRLAPGGDYREFDVNPKVRGENRGPERIVVDRKARRGWYTADHYRTFIPIEGNARGR
jgi:ribonuclease T1